VRTQTEFLRGGASLRFNAKRANMLLRAKNIQVALAKNRDVKFGKLSKLLCIHGLRNESLQSSKLASDY
jgi:hypothetical protein